MYLQRNQTELAKRYLKQFPVLCLVGARQAGKTCLSKALGIDWHYFDLEVPSDFQLISQSPELFFEQYPRRLIIDEVQAYPELFNLLRSEIDKNRSEKGRYIITGSSSPELLAGVADSLAGRVGIIEIGTLKANEYYEKPLSDFYTLFTQRHTPSTLALSEPSITNAQMRHIWLHGGYPEPLTANDAAFHQDWLKNYYATYINRDIARLFPRLNGNAYQRFISILSALSGTVINKADLGRSLEITEKTVSEYLQIAEATFLWRNISYDHTSTIKSLVKRPKGYLSDTGLLHHLQKIVDMESLLRSPLCGHSFESFVIQELIKGVQALGIANVDFQYYRTAKGAEVDFIISTPWSKIPIEVKMTKSVRLKQLMGLTKYIEDQKLPFGLVINQSDRIHWLTKNILQVPVSIL